MSKVFDFFQEAIKSCNVFTSPVNLRYKLDPDYNTFAGGMVSIILVILLMSVFFNAWKDLLNKEDISSNTEVIREFDPTYMSLSSDDFMFAIGVNFINLTDSSQKKYFNLTMTRMEMENGRSIKNETFSLEPCTLNHWEHFGEEFVQTFKKQYLNQYLCPPRNTTIDLAGKWTSKRFIFFKISFDKCHDPQVCMSEAEINQWVQKNTAFYFNFFYSNVLLNPEQTKPISMFLEDKDFSIFSSSLATFTNLYLGEYVMETDESIFPWYDTNVQSGFILNRAETESMSFIPTQSDAYCQLFLRKSNTKILIERKFRKLDDMLSYIGGLFGIIAVAFGVVMKYYGQCCFQLEMCQKIFDYQNKKQYKSSIKHNSQGGSQQITEFNLNLNQQNKNEIGADKQDQKNQNVKVIEPKDLGFIDFFLHILIYVPLKKTFNFQWQRMQIYEESLEEMRYKLDIGKLMEKLAFYDRSINVLFDQNQLKLLYLQEKFNFQEVREQRNMLEMREGLISNLFGPLQDSYSNISEQCEVLQHKKSLKEIAQRRSKKIESIMGPSKINFLEFWINDNQKDKEQKNNEISLPREITNALKKLDSKIEKGDIISTRIYNGLEYGLLEAFEKSKMNKNNYSVATSKKVKKFRMITQNQQQAKALKNKQRTCYADFVANPSLASIKQLIRENSLPA